MYSVCIGGAESCIAPVPGALVYATVNLYAAVSTFFNTGRYGVEYRGVVHVHVHVSDVSRVIRRYLSGISSRLDVCAVSRPPGPTYPIPTLLVYYPYYCILPLTPTPASYYPYYPCLLPLLPLLSLPPLLPPTTPLPPLVSCTADTYYLPYPYPHLLPLLPLLPPTYSVHGSHMDDMSLLVAG